MTEITSIAGVVIFLISLVLSVICSKNKEYPPLVSWTLLAIGLVYGLGWVAVVDAVSSGSFFLGVEKIAFNRDYWLLYNLSVFFIILGVYWGWMLLKADTFFFKKLFGVFFVSSAELTFVAWLMLIVAFVLRYLYVSAYGGFLAYLEYSRAIRSGIFEINNPWSFLQPFGHLALFASYIFWAIRREGRKTFPSFVGFWLSFSFSIYVLYSWVGRVGFLVYLCIFLLAFIYLKKISARKVLIASFVGSLAGLYFLYIISNILEIKGADNFSYYVVREISFPFVSFFAQLERGDYLFRGFSDLLLAPLYLLPSSWSVGWLEGAEQVNTLVISGAKKGDYGVTGGIPVDLITLGLMQIHIPGIFVIGFIFGILLKSIQIIFDSIPLDSLRYILMAYMAIKISFISVFYANPSNFIAAVFPIVLLLLSIMFCKGLMVVVKSGIGR